MFRVVKHQRGLFCFLESQTDSCEEATAQTAATDHAAEVAPRDSCLVQEVHKEHHLSVLVAETESPASSMVNTTHVAETELLGSNMVKPAHVTETEPRGMVKPAHVAETEEEIHITLSIPNRGRLVDISTSQNNKVNPTVSTNTDQQQTRSDLTSMKEEEEEEDESRTLRLRTGEAERTEEEDEDTDSEDTLGLLQQSKDLLTRHSMANIRMNHQDADVNYLSVLSITNYHC
jgi:hypothetical protein